MGILIENANLITRVVFAIEILPVIVVSSAFVLNGLEFFLLLGYLFITGFGSWLWLLLLTSFRQKFSQV